MPPEEFDAYCARLAELIAAGCRIRLGQLYTTARLPAEICVTSLSDEELAGLGARRELLPHTLCETYGGVEAA